MPRAATTFCVYCNQRGGCRCKKVKQPVKKDKRGSASARGYDARWRKARLIFLASNPICVQCKQGGRLEPANVVDHIKPHRGDKQLFWNMDNWQAMCKRCHDRKTASGQ